MDAAAWDKRNETSQSTTQFSKNEASWLVHASSCRFLFFGFNRQKMGTKIVRVATLVPNKSFRVLRYTWPVASGSLDKQGFRREGLF